MKLINKKNFIPTICIIYTVLSISKVILESVLNGKIDNNQGDFIWMLVISLIATFVLSLHYYLQEFPVWLVIIGQYLVLLALIMTGIWIEGHFVQLHPDAYKDMFRSFTIPYIIGAAVYYFEFWYEVKKANEVLKGLKEKNRKVM